MHAGRTLTLALGLTLATGTAFVSSPVSANLIAQVSERVLAAPIATIESNKRSTMENRIAERLGVRVENRFGVLPPQVALRKAVLQRQELLSRNVSVTLPIEKKDGKEASFVWTVFVAEHADWISFRVSSSSADFEIDKTLVASALSTSLPLGLPAVQDGIAFTNPKDKYGVTRVAMESRPSEGYEFVSDEGMQPVIAAIVNGNSSAEVPLRHRTGRIVLDNAQTLELLATGSSDYRTSPWGRQANIKKAIEQHVDNAVAPSGEVFSFNSVLGAPITKGNGWSDSLIIVNGGTLEPAPGGGICQAATTVYRAAILAGLPIVKRAPHSLYVHYYELFGLGLDATIFPGRQDMAFRNDTPGNIVMKAALEGTNVTVEFYGVPDGRTVAMQGPFVASGETEGFDRQIRSNEIGWLQTIQYADGRSEVKQIISAYNKMPRTTAQKIASSKDVQPVQVATDDDLALQY